MASIIIATIFILSIGITFILEKPLTDNIVANINIEVNENQNIEMPKITYHFQDVTDKVIMVGDIDFEKIGNYEVEYIIPTLLGKYSVYQTINIVDTKAPYIILKGEEEYKQSYARDYEEPGYEIIDNSNENLEEKVEVSKNEISESEYELVYTVSDSSGNKSSKTRKVHIVDDIPPVINLKGSENMRVALNSKYVENGATATDEKDGDLTDKIKISGNVDTNKVRNIYNYI